MGHNKGLEAMKEIIKVCLDEKIKSISFFAFSTEN
ncbi:undecaprenyl diphosphate synthase family protein [bacterium]|nr:undecaprenyl diphosphate synthase family protein [bacterium]MBR2652331.1 undecaprenyl diphosphate synthase family protein [bacterium]MBR2857796.1 undecaprenyl diphosphate synthase family protein [bacterium]